MKGLSVVFGFIAVLFFGDGGTRSGLCRGVCAFRLRRKLLHTRTSSAVVNGSTLPLSRSKTTRSFFARLTALSGGAISRQKKKAAFAEAKSDELAKQVTVMPTSSRLDRFLQRIYETADTNHDGRIDFIETYELVLKMYVKLNRQAAIPPPSREKVMRLFLKYDTDLTNSISKDEFKHLTKALARRALSRLVANKMVTLIGAPLLAETIVRKCAGRSWPRTLAAFLIPKRFHDRVLPTVTSPTFGRTILLIVLVSTLGNIVMSTVNWMLDMSLPDYDSMDEETKKRIARIERGG